MATKCIVISDPEGFSIENIYEKHIKTADGDLKALATVSDTSTTLYICGDILDSTTPGPMTFDKKYKSHNLRNIKFILDNPNIRLLFGNRDLNKLKTKFLCELAQANPANDLIQQFNNGMIKLDHLTYTKLKNNIVWTAEMKHWYPFWSQNANATETKIANGTTIISRAWASEPDYSTNPFLKRFNVIFGTDTSVGTMSAGNLLETIYIELCEMFDYFDKTKTSPADDDYKAFLVLAIFRSMVLKADTDNYVKQPLNTFKKYNIIAITSAIFKGWLYKLYTDPNNNVAECLEYCCNKDHAGIITSCSTTTNSTCHKNIVLLSHGGIPEPLIISFKAEAEDQATTNPAQKQNKVNKLAELKNWLNTNSSISTGTDLVYTKMHNPPSATQSGGYINNSSSKTVYNNTYSALNNYITNINNIFKDSICKVLESKTMPDNKPDNDMLFLLITVADTKIETSNFKFESKLHGPIMSGFEVMRTNHLLLKDTTLYQVFGHKPVGYAATVDLFKSQIQHQTNSTTYHITLDTSSSFTGTSTHNISDKDMSFNCFYINDKSFKVYSKINATFQTVKDIKQFKVLSNNTDNNTDIKNNIKKNNPYLIYSPNSKYLKRLTSSNNETYKADNTDKIKLNNLIIDYDLNSYTDIFDLMVKQKLIDNQINFHGAIQANSGSKYFIFTYNEPGSFDKTLYYLNMDDFGKLIYDPNNTQAGGSFNASELDDLRNQVSELKHKLKKYKTKYTETKTKSNTKSKTKSKTNTNR